MISELHLEHFRNHAKADFSFSRLTVITGKNGAGKTSVLEAIVMLSLTTSWKTDKDSEVVQWDQPFARVLSGDMELMIQSAPYLKRMRIDGVSKRVQQVLGYFPTILFQPDDIQLLYGPPAFRRHYLDRLLSQSNSRYTQAIVQLQQVLKQRNRLLKNIQEGIAREEELLFWDAQLAEVQEIIQPLRQEFIAFLNTYLPPVFQEMVPEGEMVSIQYMSSPHCAETEQYDFETHLRANRVREIAAGITLYGPHREDIAVHWGSHLAEQGMSRGQSRSLLVAFKIAELQYLSEKAEERPVLLLDDIFSELDLDRRSRLFNIFGEYQVIMTTTELGPVKDLVSSDTSVIEV
jgi:DNA replication and repair protein RecF